MTICNSLLSLLFFVSLDSAKNLGVVFIPDEGPGGYEGVSVSVKGQKTYWGLKVGFCQRPISIVGWTLNSEINWAQGKGGKDRKTWLKCNYNPIFNI